MATKAKSHLVVANLDAINAYGEIERICIEAAIWASPNLKRLLPLFEPLYKKGARELWYYDNAGNFVLGTRNKRGVQQDCVLGMFILCLTTRSIYVR